MASFGEEVKPSVPCKFLWHVKYPCGVWQRYFAGKINGYLSPSFSLLRYYVLWCTQRALMDESGMILSDGEAQYIIRWPQCVGPFAWYYPVTVTSKWVFWASYLSNGLSSYVRFQVLTAASMKSRIVFWDQGWWRQHAPLKRRSTIILHGSTSKKTILDLSSCLGCIVFRCRTGVKDEKGRMQVVVVFLNYIPNICLEGHRTMDNIRNLSHESVSAAEFHIGLCSTTLPPTFSWVEWDC
jgi:hypothetical protein